MAAGRMGQMDRAFATFQEFSGLRNFTVLLFFLFNVLLIWYSYLVTALFNFCWLCFLPIFSLLLLLPPSSLPLFLLYLALHFLSFSLLSLSPYLSLTLFFIFPFISSTLKLSSTSIYSLWHLSLSYPSLFSLTLYPLFCLFFFCLFCLFFPPKDFSDTQWI